VANGVVELTEIGNIELDAFVVMPEHLHDAVRCRSMWAYDT
jgi:hypothetical protein